MIQYPDSIVITVAGTATQNATTGEWTAGTPTIYTFDCRAEANVAAKKIAGQDGVLIDYVFNCYLPLMSTVIPVGSDFTLNSLSNGVIKGTIKRASNGQLNSRLWL